MQQTARCRLPKLHLELELEQVFITTPSHTHATHVTHGQRRHHAVYRRSDCLATATARQPHPRKRAYSTPHAYSNHTKTNWYARVPSSSRDTSAHHQRDELEEVKADRAALLRQLAAVRAAPSEDWQQRDVDTLRGECTALKAKHDQLIAVRLPRGTQWTHQVSRHASALHATTNVPSCGFVTACCSRPSTHPKRSSASPSWRRGAWSSSAMRGRLLFATSSTSSCLNAPGAHDCLGMHCHIETQSGASRGRSACAGGNQAPGPGAA